MRRPETHHLIEAYRGSGGPKRPSRTAVELLVFKQAEFYRKKAREMRALAKLADDTTLAAKLNDVALEYDRVAKEAAGGS